MKKFIKIAIPSLFLIFGGGYIFLASFNKEVKVGEFFISDYSSVMIDFKSEIVLGRISDKYDVLKHAERIWLNIYGKDIKDEKPYEIFYDKEENIWLVTGSIPENIVGGVAYILIREKDGKVLAVWHDK